MLMIRFYNDWSNKSFIKCVDTGISVFMIKTNLVSFFEVRFMLLGFGFGFIRRVDYDE